MGKKLKNHKKGFMSEPESYKNFLGEYGSKILSKLLVYFVVFSKSEVAFLREAARTSPAEWTEETCKEIHRLAVILHESGIEQIGGI